MTTVAGFSKDVLHELAGWEAPTLVSVYVPVDFSRPQAAETLTKALRHAARTATTRLVDEHQVGPSGAIPFVAPLLASSLLDGVPR